MTDWLLTIVLIVAQPVIEEACLRIAKEVREKLGGIGFVAVTCDPVAAMPYIKRRGNKI